MSIICPRQCAIAFGIPTCKRGFINNETSDYLARSYPDNVYSEYDWDLVHCLNLLVPGLRDVGVTLSYDVTSWDLAELFKQHRVVVLFSHWTDAHPMFPLGAVELGEGLVDIDTIVDAVPQDFDGFLDLCMCFPEKLIEALLYARPRCHLKFVRNRAKPNIWLLFYGTLFQLLYEQPMSFPDALVRTQAKLIGRLPNGGMF